MKILFFYRWLPGKSGLNVQDDFGKNVAVARSKLCRLGMYLGNVGYIVKPASDALVQYGKTDNMNMTGRERLWAALTCQPVDELPILLQGMDPRSSTRKYRDSSWDPVFERNAEAGDILTWWWEKTAPTDQGDVQEERRCLERTDTHDRWETIFTTPDGRLKQVYRDQFLTGATEEYAVKSMADLPAAKQILSQPVKVDEQATRKDFEKVTRCPNTLPMLLTNDPVERVIELLGPTQYCFMMIDAEKELLELVDIAAGPIIRKMEDVLRIGIQPVIWLDGSEMAVPPYAGPARFAKLVFPYHKRIVDIAHKYGCPVLTHCHGPIGGVLDQFLATGTDATHPFEAPPSGDITPQELKELAGGSLCAVGNIQLDDMLRAPRRKIAEQADKLLKVFDDWPKGGFILSVSATPTCREAPAQAVENYRFLLEYKNT